MNLFYFAAGALALAVSLPGASLAADRTYDLPAFTAIDIASGVDAEVTVGGSQSIAATARTDADLDELKVEVKDGTLKVWREWDILDIFEFGERETKLTIAVPVLTSAESSSGSDVNVSGMAGDAIRLEASSGADLKATDIRATTISVESSSGSDLSANGTCTTLEARVSSGANANLRDLACTDATVEASSGSDVSVRATGILRAGASSGSDIEVYGKPAKTEFEESSGSSIDLDD